MLTRGNSADSLKGATMKTASQLLEDMGTAVPMPDDTGAVAQLWELWGKEWVEGLTPNDDDIYMTMNRHGQNHRRLPDIVKPDAMAIVCTGWGAPLNPETGTLDADAPSLHPERRRVTLFTVVTPRADVASRLVMGDDEPTDDPEGGGVGALADALDACAVAVWGSEFTSSLVMQYATGKADGADSEKLDRLIERVANIAPTVREALEEGEGE
jgi:hypothetical protein